MSDYLMLEVDGAEPDTVADPLAVLELAAAYFDLVVKLAKDRGYDLGLKGLHIFNKCVAIAIKPVNPLEAQASARSAVLLVERHPKAKARHRTAVDRVRRARTGLPKQYTASVRLAELTLPLTVIEFVDTMMPWSMTTMRVVPYKAGGKNDAAVRFTSILEDYDFTLDVSSDAARELGAVLYHEVEIEAEVQRDAAGRITQGKVLRINPLDDKPDLSAWQDWFRFSGRQSQWDAADNLEEELGRD